MHRIKCNVRCYSHKGLIIVLLLFSAAFTINCAPAQVLQTCRTQPWYSVCKPAVCFSGINWCLGHDAGSSAVYTQTIWTGDALTGDGRALLCRKKHCVSQGGGLQTRNTGGTHCSLKEEEEQTFHCVSQGAIVSTILEKKNQCTERRRFSQYS